jgi:hypothetical protein
MPQRLSASLGESKDERGGSLRSMKSARAALILERMQRIGPFGGSLLQGQVLMLPYSRRLISESTTDPDRPSRSTSAAAVHPADYIDRLRQALRWMEKRSWLRSSATGTCADTDFRTRRLTVAGCRGGSEQFFGAISQSKKATLFLRSSFFRYLHALHPSRCAACSAEACSTAA